MQIPAASTPAAPAHDVSGTVKWFSAERSYGYVVPDPVDGTPLHDVYFHARDVIFRDRHEYLDDGARVRFDVLEGPHGPVADDVEEVRHDGTTPIRDVLRGAADTQRHDAVDTGHVLGRVTSNTDDTGHGSIELLEGPRGPIAGAKAVSLDVSELRVPGAESVPIGAMVAFDLEMRGAVGLLAEDVHPVNSQQVAALRDAWRAASGLDASR